MFIPTSRRNPVSKRPADPDPWGSRSRLPLRLSLAIGGAGFWWAAVRRSSGPLGPGLDAYAGGDWETSAGVARARLKEAADDIRAAQLLARASVQLGRDASALSLFDRLGPASLTADDFYLLGTRPVSHGQPHGERRGLGARTAGRTGSPRDARRC